MQKLYKYANISHTGPQPTVIVHPPEAALNESNAGGIPFPHGWGGHDGVCVFFAEWWKPVSIRYHHDLSSLARLGFSNPVSPFFGGNSTIRKSLSPFDFLFRIHSTQQRTPNPLPRTVFRPLFQPPPTGGGRTILPGHARPNTTGFSTRREFRSRFFADLLTNVQVPVWVWEEGVQSQHFTLADHVFEIACRPSGAASLE